MHRLEELTRLAGLSGHEDRVIAYMHREFEMKADRVGADHMGNVWAEVAGRPGAPRVMVFAHADEVGLQVRKVEEDGTLRVDRVGGVPEKSLMGQRVLVHAQSGDLPGVIGTKAHHLTPPDERYVVLTVERLFVDIGASSRAEAHQLGVHVGTGITYAPCFVRLGDRLVSAKSLDNRGGCWTLLRLLDRLRASPVPPTVYLVVTAQEEFNQQGVLPVARRLRPDLAACLDIVPAHDTPDLRQAGEVSLGKGAVINTFTFHARGTLAGLIPNPRLVDFFAHTAESRGIRYQFSVFMGGLTDASHLHAVGYGIPAIDLGFPCRYTHSPIETCSLDDLDSLLDLVHSALERLERLPDLSRGARGGI